MQPFAPQKIDTDGKIVTPAAPAGKGDTDKTKKDTKKAQVDEDEDNANVTPEGKDED